ncbi:hypothetical protein [Xanthomonas floridensis]|uniref:Uncharacterized protein n=1 Tax=Xanthomonas floridensis TaxID=1843580 RepID=A0ABU5Q1G3_9XANT|nr:hypothetical protein [Xanthomonas floridensis]MEA5125695.1 hypothetical protein [Xanthomonas floridensis]MEA5133570.1 hypothetical protein [Xanthomonas floridensis]
MNTNESAASDRITPQPGHKVWSTPVVSFLSIDDTAQNATTGNDGFGPTTGS